MSVNIIIIELLITPQLTVFKSAEQCQLAITKLPLNIFLSLPSFKN